MYCKHCGNEIQDQAVVCVHCGYATENAQNNNSNTNNAQFGFVEEETKGGLIALSILVPIAGLIIGITKKNEGHVKAGGTYIKCAVIAWAVSAGLSILLSTCTSAMMSSMY